ncbi:MAG: polysaccharide biosynthesis tyrosine autokinase, partial [Bacteroidetes bacterium]
NNPEYYQNASETEDNEQFFIVNSEKSLLKQIQNSLTVYVLNPAAKTVVISFKNHNPKKCTDLANTIAREYIIFDVEKRSESAKRVLEFIDTQIQNVYQKLRTSEASIQEFKKENKLSETEDFTTIYLDRLNSLENELIQLELQENVLKEIEKSIQINQENINAYNLIPLLAGTELESGISDMLETLHQLLLKKEQMLYEVKESSENVKAIEYQIGIQKKLLLESIASLKKKITARRQNIEKKTREIEKSFLEIPTKELEYNRLERIFSINEKFYTLLLEKRAEYSIAKAGYVPNNSILEEAELPPAPIKPDKKLSLISGFLGGIILSIVFFVLRYILYNTITSVQDVERIKQSNMACLGMVPKYKKEIPVSQLVIDKNPKSMISEAFRNLRTQLQFIDNKPGKKIVAVTSTISGEGKTFVAINLAGIIAFSGKKVILLDLDMRKPKVHIGFGADNTTGMSTLLINKTTLEETVHHSSLKNLDFITAGPLPPNPSELIISEEFDNLLEQLKQKYDYIVIDNPPVGLVTDGISCIKKAD